MQSKFYFLPGEILRMVEQTKTTVNDALVFLSEAKRCVALCDKLPERSEPLLTLRDSVRRIFERSETLLTLFAPCDSLNERSE